MEKLRTFLPNSCGKYFAKHCVVLIRISFLASVHSKTLFIRPFFSYKKCINFHNFFVSLPKIRQPLSLSLTISVVLCFSISFLFFSLCDFFLKDMACSESLLMLERKIEQNKNRTLSCFLYSSSSRSVQLFALQPDL